MDLVGQAVDPDQDLPDCCIDTIISIERMITPITFISGYSVSKSSLLDTEGRWRFETCPITRMPISCYYVNPQLDKAIKTLCEIHSDLNNKENLLKLSKQLACPLSGKLLRNPQLRFVGSKALIFEAEVNNSNDNKIDQKFKEVVDYFLEKLKELVATLFEVGDMETIESYRLASTDSFPIKDIIEEYEKNQKAKNKLRVNSRPKNNSYQDSTVEITELYLNSQLSRIIEKFIPKPKKNKTTSSASRADRYRLYPPVLTTVEVSVDLTPQELMDFSVEFICPLSGRLMRNPRRIPVTLTAENLIFNTAIVYETAQFTKERLEVYLEAQKYPNYFYNEHDIYAEDEKLKAAVDGYLAQLQRLVVSIFEGDNADIIAEYYEISTDSFPFKQLAEELLKAKPQYRLKLVPESLKRELLTIIKEQNIAAIDKIVCNKIVGKDILLVKLDQKRNALEVAFDEYKTNGNYTIKKMLSLIIFLSESEALRAEISLLTNKINELSTLRHKASGIAYSSEGRKIVVMPENNRLMFWAGEAIPEVVLIYDCFYGWEEGYALKKPIKQRLENYMSDRFSNSAMINLLAVTKEGKLLIVYTNGYVGLLDYRKNLFEVGFDYFFVAADIKAAAWCSSRNQLAYCSSTGIYYWDPVRQTSTLYTELYEHLVTAISVNSNAQLIVATNKNEKWLTIFDGENILPIWSFKIDEEATAVYQMEHPQLKNLIIVGHKNSFSIWDVDSGNKVGQCKNNDMEIYDIKEFPQEGKLLVADARGEGIAIWNVETQKLLKRLDKNEGCKNYYIDNNGILVNQREILDKDMNFFERLWHRLDNEKAYLFGFRLQKEEYQLPLELKMSPTFKK